MKITSVFLIVALISLSSANAVEPPSTEQTMQQEMMKKMQDAGKPAAEHELLKPLVGTWSASSSWRMSPEQEFERSSANVTRSWVLGGLFVQESYIDQSSKTPFSGLGMMGYDKVMNEFTATWYDTMSTATWQSTGHAGSEGKVISFQGAGSCPMTGGKKENRSELEIVSNDTNIYRMFDKTSEGKEFKALEIVYQRTKG